mmetsp:Transcript_11984/g.44526  ORF Transcript_11984/g.44526 Transcript_11984/m.44526 type:complete len:353 (-) Transcript_11984:207-1265(-)
MAAKPDWKAVFSSILTAHRAEELVTQGYVIVDGAFGPSLAMQMRREVLQVHEEGLMEENCVMFGSQRHVKPFIFEADLFAAERRAACATLGDLWEEGATEMAARLNEKVPTLALGETREDIVVKLQLNEGSGGCFPWHYDNPGPPNKRKVTALVYLNPDWEDGHGGELLLLPFLEPAEDAICIAPLHDRLVLFLSDSICHRVMPSLARRVAFTVWLDSGVVNGDEDVYLRAKHLAVEETWLARADEAATAEQGQAQESAAEEPTAPPSMLHLRMSPLQRSLSRYVYREAYEASIQDCMGIREDALLGMQLMLLAHKKACERSAQNELLNTFVRVIRWHVDQVRLWRQRSAGT